MSWLKLLYGTLIFMVAIDAIASTLTAMFMFRIRKNIGHYMAWAFTGIAAEATTAIITTGFGSPPQKIIIWTVTVRILVRLFKTVTMALLPLYLLGYFNGDKKEAKGAE